MIEVRNLTKIYGDHAAVSDLSFTVPSGQIYGFLGPNGAGKTTTMNIITGCLAATSGSVSINGYDIFEDADKAKRLIGYLPEEPPLYPDMTPYEYLDFVAKAKRVPKAEREHRIDEVMKLTRITSVADRLIRNLSKGYRQRVGIAQAILGDPEIIILDEPTVGLDPKQIIEIRELIKSLGENHTVILSSHILSEVRALCDNVLIISRGKLVACDTPENLEKLFSGSSTIELTVRAEEDEVRNALSGIINILEISYKKVGDDGRAEVAITTDGKEDISEKVFFAFCDIRRPILRMNHVRASLEDVFVELTSAKDGAKVYAEKQEDAELESMSGDGSDEFYEGPGSEETEETGNEGGDEQ
ncbi:MAG: ABC transporter ATP-binding protein [Clostridiales bacterium]|nr:ABC transporter ATP-binding protein [Clostridiales bacterium]